MKASTNTNTQLLFCYGTLKAGLRYHHLLSGSDFIAKFGTAAVYTMYHLGAYPAVTKDGHTAIQGEIYKISSKTLKELDAYEEYPDLYDRIQIKTPFGLAWMYVLDPSAVTGKKVITSGNWP